MGQKAEEFHWVDYLVFAVVLLISAGIGLFYGFVGGKQKTQEEYLMANRGMNTIPVALSLCVSFISAILILGAPAEVYTQGGSYFIYSFGIGISCILTCLIFVPLLFPLKLVSSYEYLELRFKSKAVKLVGTLLLITSQTLYMGIATYSPSTALEAVTGFPVWASIVSVGIISTFYTTLGGMKAVVWTDTFQTVIMVGGLVAVVVVGSIECGGIAEVWRINEEGGRFNFDGFFDPDPRVRHSFWSLIFGASVTWLATYGVNQASVQRFCSLPTINKARIAMLLNVPGVIFLVGITSLSGLVIFAYFEKVAKCDPLRKPINPLDNSNQLIPHFVMEVLGWPGVPGLFVSTLFAGALSTMSSVLNACAAITWEDMLKWKYDYLSENTKTLITKGLVFFYGCAGVGMAFAAEQMGGTVLQASLSFTGSAMSPLLGLFLLGGFFPFANWVGAVAGGIVGLILPMWISIGSYVVAPYHPPLNTTLENCEYPNFTATADPSLEPPEPPRYPEDMEGVEKLYTLSYLWFPATGTLTTILLGCLVSLLAAPVIGCSHSDDVERKYLIPIFDWCCCCLPNKWREPCRCGYEDEPEIGKESGLDQDLKELKTDYKPTHERPSYHGTNYTAFVEEDDVTLPSKSSANDTSPEMYTEEKNEGVDNPAYVGDSGEPIYTYKTSFDSLRESVNIESTDSQL